jgi:hypothetical protein
MHAQLATIDPGLYNGNAMDFIVNSGQIASLRNVAASLKAFSKKAAKDPLSTGT